jgi:hypothetical protein
MMYLKQVTQEALDPADYLTFEAGAFLESISEEGHLPGWSKNRSEIDWTADAPDDSVTYPVSRTFKFQIGGWIDVTPKIKSLAAVGAFSVPVNNRLAGRDPAPDILKRLRLDIGGYGLQRTVEVIEGETLALPAGVKIITARYGNLEGENADLINERGDPSTFHYAVVRESKDMPWKLQKAWRTGTSERKDQEYPAP